MSPGRFTNEALPTERPGIGAMVGLMARKIWTSFFPRPGAAPLVPYHGAALAWNPSITWIGHSTFLVRMDGVTAIGARLGPIDLATVPIGAYRPDVIMHYMHTTPEEALRIGLDAQARRMVAMHFGTFDLADEPLDEPPQRFRAEAERLGLGPDRAVIMSIGETRAW